MPSKPPLCPAYSAAQTQTLTTIPEDLYSPLRPQEQAVFDNWAWSTVLTPPLPSITNFSLPSSHQSNRLGNLAQRFKKISTAKRPSPPPYLPTLSKEHTGLGFVFTEMLDSQDLTDGAGTNGSSVVDADTVPLQTWLQDRLEAEQTREDFEKEACAATEALKETDTGTESSVAETKASTIKGPRSISPSTPRSTKRKGSKADSLATAEQSSPRNNIFSPTGRILGISATLFAPTLGKRKSGTMTERTSISFDSKRIRRSSLSSLSITQLDKVTPLFASPVISGPEAVRSTTAGHGVTAFSDNQQGQDMENVRPTATLTRKRSLRRTVSSLLMS